jgi:hypothetical protein
MIECLRAYFIYGLKEFIEPESAETEMKHKLGNVFVEYCNELYKNSVGIIEVIPSEFRQNYLDYSADSEKYWSAKKISYSIIEYFKMAKSGEFIGAKSTRRDGKPTRVIQIKIPNDQAVSSNTEFKNDGADPPVVEPATDFSSYEPWTGSDDIF